MTTARTNADLITDWPAIMREDGRRVEIICPHGVGHPVKSLSHNWDDRWMGVHGCDGCCSKAIFALAEIAHCHARGLEPFQDKYRVCDHEFAGSNVCVKCGWQPS